MAYSASGSVTFAFLPLGDFYMSVCFKTTLTHWEKLKKKHSAVSFKHYWRNFSPFSVKHKNIEIMLCWSWYKIILLHITLCLLSDRNALVLGNIKHLKYAFRDFRPFCTRNEWVNEWMHNFVSSLKFKELIPRNKRGLP